MLLLANVFGDFSIEDLWSLSIVTDVLVPIVVATIAVFKISKEIRETRNQNNRNYEASATRATIQIIRETYSKWIAAVFTQLNYPSISEGDSLAKVQRDLYIAKNDATINNYQTQLLVLFNPFVDFDNDILTLIRAIIGKAGHNNQIDPNMHNYRLLLNYYIGNYIKVQSQTASLEMQWSKNTKALTKLKEELTTQVNDLVNKTLSTYSIHEKEDKLEYLTTIKSLKYITITNYQIDPNE